MPFGSFARGAQGFQRTSEDLYRSAGGAFAGASTRARQAGQFGQGLQSEYYSQHRPMARQIARYARVNPEAAVGQAALGVGRSFDKALGMRERYMSRRGVDPSMGAFDAQKWAMARAAAEAGAKSRARRMSREQSMTNMLRAAQLTAPLAGQAIGALGQSQQGLLQAGGAQERLAGQYGGLASDVAFQEELDDLFGGADRDVDVSATQRAGDAMRSGFDRRPDYGYHLWQ